jgi:hypothetical protein
MAVLFRRPGRVPQPSIGEGAEIETGSKQLSRKGNVVAEDAVLIGPVSTGNTLLTGKFTGNFAIFGSLG